MATAALALLAVLALGVAAATLDSATTTASGGFGAGPNVDEGGLGSGESGPAGIDGGGGETQFSVNVCVAFLTDPRVQAALLALVGGFVVAMYRTTRSWLLSAFSVAAVSFPFGVLYLALISCGSTPTETALALGAGAAPNESLLPGGGGSAGANAAGEALSAPTVLVGLLLFVAIAGSVLLLFVSTGDDETPVADPAPEPPAPERRAEVGRRAGAAADRLESDADLENEVYRAWREMTGALAVDNPRATTPKEFADAAVEAGMARADVAALTEAFEAVRYGDAPVTPERETAAVEALRRIEAAYAGDDLDAEAVGGSGDTDPNGGDAR